MDADGRRGGKDSAVPPAWPWQGRKGRRDREKRDERADMGPKGILELLHDISPLQLKIILLIDVVSTSKFQLLSLSSSKSHFARCPTA